MGRRKMFKNFHNAARYQSLQLHGAKSIKFFGKDLDDVMRLPRKSVDNSTTKFYHEFLSSQNHEITSSQNHEITSSPDLFGESS